MKRYLILAFLFVLFFGMQAMLKAQQNIIETNRLPIIPGETSVISLPAKSVGLGNISAIKSIRFELTADMSNAEGLYLQGNEASGNSFDYTISMQLIALNNTGEVINDVFENDIYKLEVSNLHPLSRFKTELSDLIDNSSLIHTTDLAEIQVANPVLSTKSGSDLVDELSLTASLIVEYGTGVTYNGESHIMASIPKQVSINSKTATFHWQDTYPFTMYQLQVLRLYNLNESYTSEKEILAKLEWENAVTVNIPVENVFDVHGNIIEDISTELTLGQGQGYYAWRVRPIGTYYEGGIANALNWGRWSYASSGTLVVNESTPSYSFFFFTDPDNDKNSIYSKVYSEENKTKEIQTFANGLNQVKQTKTYLAENNVTITSQSLTDYSGAASLSTLPLPTEGKSDTYTEAFATSGDALYTSDNFDTDNLGQAQPMDEKREMDYYNNNPDVRIPDAQGYPFTQTTTYNDPLNRVYQQGGPGETHLIRNDLTGRNTKYFYATPSQDELIRIFGDEAPNANTVSKTIKVDANDVATITYTSQNGNILATCISFYETENDRLEPIREINSFNVSDEITFSTESEMGFLSTKRLAILQPSDVVIDYEVGQAALEINCAKIAFDCEYALDIIVRNIMQEEPVYELKNHLINGVSPLDGKYRIDPVHLTLTPGTYTIEKRLKPLSENYNEESVRKSMLEQIQPLVSLVSGWLDSIHCYAMVKDFNDKLWGLQDALNNATLEAYVYQTEEEFPEYMRTFIDEVYNKELPESPGEYYRDFYSISFLSWSAENGYEFLEPGSTVEPDMAIISTNCCDIPMQVRWIKSWDIEYEPTIADKDGNNQYDIRDVIEAEYEGIPYDFIPDYEGYAIAYFRDCPKLNVEGDDGSFYDYMEGWGDLDQDGTPDGILNLMVYHMLKDELIPWVHNEITEAEKIENGKIVDPKPERIDDCGNIISYDWQNSIYVTKDLFECWVTQLQRLRGQIACDDIVFETGLEGQNINPADEIDNKTGDPSELNDKLDEGFEGLSRRKKRKIQKKLSEEVRDMSIDDGSGSEVDVEVEKFHLVKGFLDCAGYRFAKILTPYDPEPLPADKAPGVQYNEIASSGELPDGYKYKLNETVDMATYLSDSRFKKAGTYDFYYFPLNDWGPTKVVIEEDEQKIVPIFPRIKNPIYAFKYYEYPEEGFERYMALENIMGYTDPNDCYEFDAEGYLVQKPGGGISKVPCCQLPSGDLRQFCYKDYKYPNLDYFYDPSSLVYGEDAEGKFRYIVNDFQGAGWLKAAYDHTVWSSGQRYSFYQAIIHLRETEFDDWNEYQGRTCDILETPRRWYDNSFPDGSIIYPGLPRMVTAEEKGVVLAYLDQYNFPFDITDLQQYTDIPTLDGDEDRDEVAYVEMELVKMKRSCVSACMERKSEFYTAIVEYMQDNCYDIGGCKGGGEGTIYEHVVPRKDIVEMTHSLMFTCISQCTELNSFACNDVNSREITTPKTELGPNSFATRLLLGIGGLPLDESPECDQGALVQYNDEANIDASYTYGDIYGDAESEIIKYKLDNYPNVADNKINTDTYSWYQNTILQQARMWDFEINLPSKCDQLTLEVEDASAIEKAYVTSEAVEKVRGGTIIAFKQFDFGNGIEKMAIELAMPQAVAGYVIQIRLGSSTGEIIGTLSPAVTGNISNFTLQEIPLNRTVSGVEDLYIRVSGPSAEIGSIDKVIAYAPEGTYSNARQFSTCDEEGSTYIPPSEYELRENELIDINNIRVGDPVKSPAKRIELDIE